MIYGSVCSGIEAASVAWHPLGWRASFLSEIEPFPRAVLQHHYPDVPLHGDFTTIGDEYEPIDLLVGGTPCQSFSVAGLRGGLDDNRGNLALEFLRLADRTRPRWVVWENVPGVLSSNGGRDFGSILGGLGELGYGWAYRVLDAQYVRVDSHPRAVPQRRRRVFVVGYLGDWRRAAAVLFERESMCGHSAPRREAGEGSARSVIKGAAIGRKPEAGPQRGDVISDGSCFTLTTNEVHAVSPTLSARTKGGGGLGTDFDCDGGLVPSTGPVSHCLNAGGMGRLDYETETLVAFSAINYGADVTQNVCPTLLKGGEGGFGHGMSVAFDPNQITSKANRSIPGGDVLHTMPGTANPPHLASPMSVRRLLPVECERLQGFPDSYTAVPYRGKPAADGPRYKALGNSMAVNVMSWIGQRIALVETNNPATEDGVAGRPPKR